MTWWKRGDRPPAPPASGCPECRHKTAQIHLLQRALIELRRHLLEPKG